MKNLLKSLVSVAVLATACGASAAEEMAATEVVETVANSEATSVVFPQVQKYAEVCLGNLTDRAVLVGTSWTGEARHMAYVLPGERHLYRLETTGTIPAGLDDSVQYFNVAFRARGVLTRFDVENVMVGYSYQPTNRCTLANTYNFINVSTGLVPRLKLVPFVQILPVGQ